MHVSVGKVHMHDLLCVLDCNFLISPQKHIFWVLIRSTLSSASNEYYYVCFCGEIGKMVIFLVENTSCLLICCYTFLKDVLM